MSALEEIAAERNRQISFEGWSPEHDDTHDKGQLAYAGACYALTPLFARPVAWSDMFTRLWPWDQQWWKPTDRRRDLVKAGALIVAEIERIDRAAIKTPRLDAYKARSGDKRLPKLPRARL